MQDPERIRARVPFDDSRTATGTRDGDEAGDTRQSTRAVGGVVNSPQRIHPSGQVDGAGLAVRIYRIDRVDEAINIPGRTIKLSTRSPPLKSPHVDNWNVVAIAVYRPGIARKVRGRRACVSACIDSR